MPRGRSGTGPDFGSSTKVVIAFVPTAGGHGGQTVCSINERVGSGDRFILRLAREDPLEGYAEALCFDVDPRAHVARSHHGDDVIGSIGWGYEWCVWVMCGQPSGGPHAIVVSIKDPICYIYSHPREAWEYRHGHEGQLALGQRTQRLLPQRAWIIGRAHGE